MLTGMYAFRLLQYIRKNIKNSTKKFKNGTRTETLRNLSTSSVYIHGEFLMGCVQTFQKRGAILNQLAKSAFSKHCLLVRI